MKRLTFTCMAGVGEELEKSKTGEVVVDEVPLEQLEFVQLRDPATERPVTEYAERWKEGADFPPLEAYWDPATGQAVVYDGNTRAEAARMAGKKTISLRFRLGTRRDAILAGAGVNDANGLRPSQADKRAAIYALISDAEWAAWSNNRIARLVKVAPQTVERAREEREPAIEAQVRGLTKPTKRKVERGGKVYEYDVAAKRARAAKKVDPEQVVERIVAQVKRASSALNTETRMRLAERISVCLRGEHA